MPTTYLTAKDISKAVFKHFPDANATIPAASLRDKSTGIPDLSYGSENEKSLALFLLFLYEIAPKAAPYVKQIIIDANHDNAKDSAVIPLLYEQDWSATPEPGGPTQLTMSGMAVHPFQWAIDCIADERDTANTDPSPLLNDEPYYIGIIAMLLRHCVNVSDVWLPRSWIPHFPRKTFPALRHVWVTEDLDDEMQDMAFWSSPEYEAMEAAAEKSIANWRWIDMEGLCLRFKQEAEAMKVLEALEKERDRTEVTEEELEKEEAELRGELEKLRDDEDS